MKIQTTQNGFQIEFLGGGTSMVTFSEIHTIDLETVPTMSVDVDFVSIGYESGDFLEITDDAEGFHEFCVELSTVLMINPSIHLRFPIVSESAGIRVYERTPS